VKHPAQNTSLKLYPLFLIMQFNVQSSAVKGLRTEGDQVFITFPNGREYTYNAADVTKFTTAVSEAIAQQDSVGTLVNRAIRSKQLTLA
jgi:hypothetical protein